MQNQGERKKYSFARKRGNSQINLKDKVAVAPQAPKMNIFHMTEKIDRRIKQHLKKKAYIFIGKSRSGKSTAMNWTNGVSLKGVIQNKKVVFQVDVRDNDNKIGHGFESCTIIPNISRRGDYSIIDTAGFGDTRNYEKMIGVSYGLQAIFDCLQEAKFILVVTRSDLTSPDGKVLTDNLNYFLKMFRMKDLTKRQREQIYQSVTILVTASEPKENHLATLEAIGGQLVNQELGNIENVDYMIELLEELIDRNRICAFNKAVENCPPQQCNIIDAMETKDWEYLKFNNDDKRIRFIHLPINEDFGKLPQKDKQQFAENIKRKIESFKEFSKNLSDFILQEMTISSVIKGEETARQVYTFNKFKQPFDRFFGYLDVFLQKHDHYNSEQLIDLKESLRDVFPHLENDKLLEQLIKMKRSFQQINQQDNGSHGQYAGRIFDEIKAALQSYLQSLIKIFARNKEQYKKLLRLRFILLRSIRQLLMLSKVSRNSGVHAIQGIKNQTYYTIRGGFANIDDSTKMIKDFIEWFRENEYERITVLNKNKKNPVSRFIHSREQAFNIEYILVENRRRLDKLLDINVNKESERINFQICYYRTMRDIKLIYAKYEYDEGKIQNSLMNLIAAFRIDGIYRYYREKELEDEQDKEKLQNEKEQILLNQANILDDIIRLLLKLKKYNLSVELALFLDMKDTVCNIYEAQISQHNRKDKKLNIQKMTEYAKYCFINLRAQTGTVLYQKMIQSELQSVKKRKKYQKQLLLHLANRDFYVEEFRNNLEKTAEKDYNSRLSQIINRIETAVALDARHREQIINHSKNNFVENLSEVKFNIEESAKKNGDYFYVNELTYEHKQLGVIASQYSDISDYRHDDQQGKQQLKINIYNPEDISDFTYNFLELYQKYPDKTRLILKIDIRQMELHHYLVTEKYVVIKFTKELVDSAANKIKLIKFIKEIIYENGENIKQAVSQISYCFEQQAINKMRELCLLYEGKINDIDLMRILKETKENLSESIAVSNYVNRYAVKMIPLEVVEKIVLSWKKFLTEFNQRCDEVIFMSYQRNDDSDSLIFCDF